MAHSALFRSVPGSDPLPPRVQGGVEPPPRTQVETGEDQRRLDGKNNIFSPLPRVSGSAAAGASCVTVRGRGWGRGPGGRATGSSSSPSASCWRAASPPCCSTQPTCSAAGADDDVNTCCASVHLWIHCRYNVDITVFRMLSENKYMPHQSSAKLQASCHHVISCHHFFCIAT